MNLTEKINKNWIKTIFLCVGLFFLNSCSFEPEKAPDLPNPPDWLNRPTHYSNPDFNSKVVLLEFLTDQCDACLQQLPALKELKKKYDGTIDFVIIYTPSSDQTLSKFRAAQFIQTLGLDSPVIFDKKAKLFNDYKVSVWPTLILITNGEIKKRFYGVNTFDYLNQKIQKLLDEKK